MQVIDILIILLGLSALALLGLRFSRENTSTEDYFLGGRQIPGWLLGISMVGTSVSSITFLAHPAAAFALDWRLIVNNLMLPIGAAVAIFVFIPLYRNWKITTAFQYLEMRFGRILRIYGAVSFVILQLLRLSTILYLVSLPISFLLGANDVVVIVAAGVFISVYTMFGGLKAVVWTDFAQSILLLGGGILCVGLIVWALPGGFSQVLELGLEKDKFSIGEFDWNFARRTFWTMTALGVFQWLVAYSSDQTVIQRYMAASSLREAKKAVLITLAVSIPLWAFFFFLGTALFVFFTIFPDVRIENMEADSILPFFLKHHVLTGLSGLITLGILAAAMSSIDSGINSISTVMFTDVFLKEEENPANGWSSLSLARSVSGAVGVVMICGAIVYYYMPKESMLDLQVIVTALFGGCLGGLFLAGIFSQRIDNLSAILATLIAISWNIYFVLNQFGVLPADLTLFLHPYWIGIFVNAIFLLSAYGISYLGSPRNPSVEGLTAWTMGKKQKTELKTV